MKLSNPLSRRLDMDATKKDEILNAALEEFAEVGFKEATVRQICKRAKANVCLVSYYFDGKEGLYRAVFERAYNEKQDVLGSTFFGLDQIQTKEEFQNLIRAYIEQLHLKMMGNMSFFRLIHREFFEGMPRLEDLLTKFISLTQKQLFEYFSYGHKKKFIKKDLDPNIVAAALMNLISGFVHQEAVDKPNLFFPGIPNKEIADQINKVITTVFLNGVIQ